MTRDLLADLGVLALGSRLKRLTERIMTDVSRVFAELDYDFQPSMFPLIACLDRYGEVGVVEAARLVGYSQPAITRALNTLVQRGYVDLVTDEKDSRQKIIRLSASGRDLLDSMKQRIWPAVVAAVEEACPEKGTALLAELAQIESALEETPLFDRIMEKVHDQRTRIHR